MKSGLKKRMIAYLIDLILVGIILGMTITIKEKDQTVMQLKSDLNIVNELYASKEIKFEDYFERSTTIHQQLDQECIIYTIFNICFILGYFVLFQYIMNGQTIGKKLVKIKVISLSEDKVPLMGYVIRNMIINGLGYMILMMLFLYLLPSTMYFVISTILSFIQLALVTISIFMILYRKDKRGLHDILSGTKVILVS